METVEWRPKPDDTQWNVFAKTSRFNTMTTWSTDGADFEGMHGGVHIITGGHMGPPDWTAYDPLL